MSAEDPGSRIERERAFHDRWAAESDVYGLSPEKVALCATTPETRHALQALGSLGGREILEVGCGQGELTVWLALQGAKVRARDVSPRMIEVARRLAQRRGMEGRIGFDVGPGEMLPYEDSQFDLVFGHDVLHHMDLTRAIAEVRRVLKTGGRAVFAEPLGHNPILNRYREASPETRTADERPLLFRDIDAMKPCFASASHREFHLFTMGIFLWFRWVERLDPNEVRYWKRIIDEAERYRRPFAALSAVDALAFRLFPPSRRWARMTVIELRT